MQHTNGNGNIEGLVAQAAKFIHMSLDYIYPTRLCLGDIPGIVVQSDVSDTGRQQAGHVCITASNIENTGRLNGFQIFLDDKRHAAVRLYDPTEGRVAEGGIEEPFTKHKRSLPKGQPSGTLMYASSRLNA